jgi:murein DD-endopeptidase MepM/ murein hydrolase activator NlpD
MEASNGRRIVDLARLGSCGNWIVVDRSRDLQTIYGHLSRIDVNEGGMVKCDQVMELSGQTRMTGGDHSHFAMQLDGVRIDSKQWWGSTGSTITLHGESTCPIFHDKRKRPLASIRIAVHSRGTSRTRVAMNRAKPLSC